jgi:hypothetical protein
MHRMGWDTRKPSDVSRGIWLPKGFYTYVHEHNDDGIHRDDRCCAPEEHPVLCGDVSHLSGAKCFNS